MCYKRNISRRVVVHWSSPELSFGSYWIPALPNSTSSSEAQPLGKGSCASSFTSPPFWGVFPPPSQVLNSLGTASHVLQARVQVYLRRGKCYYGNYNSIKKQSIAVSVQDHKNAHQLNSFLLQPFKLCLKLAGIGVQE